MINGIVGIVGGIVNVEVDSTAQMKPALIIDYVLRYEASPSDFTYVSSDDSVATVDSDGLVTAVGEEDDTCQITLYYTDADTATTYQDTVDVIIREEGWTPVDPSASTDDAAAENILYGKKATVNGVQITGTAAVYVSDNTLVMPEGLIYAVE